MRKILLGLLAVVTIAAASLAAAPAYATSISVTVVPDSTPAVPGTGISVSISDPSTEFCAAVPGDSVRMYINFYNEYNEAVSYTYADKQYVLGGTYSWTSQIFWATTGIPNADTQNWTLTPRASCWDGNDVTNPGTPDAAPIVYAPTTQTASTVAAGGDVTFTLTDLLTSYGWCDTWTQSLGGVNPSSFAPQHGSSALVHFIDASGRDTVVPVGWTSGQSGIGLWDDTSSSITVPVTVPSSLAPGDYTVGLECVTSTFVQRGPQALAFLTVTPGLADTGTDQSGVLFGAAGGGIAVLLGLIVIAVVRRRRA